MAKKLRFALFLCLFFLSLPLYAREAAAPDVMVVHIEGVINPVTAEFLDKSIKTADESRADAVVIMLDTPGGLDTSMRQMVKAITGSPVPVITYVAPTGARAASAGVFITMASSVAAMAPGTNIGAAHPVSMGGEKLTKEMSQKLENDAAAYITSLAEKYGRNAKWAALSVRKSVSISESEAVKTGVVDLVADNVDDLLKKADGRKVMTGIGPVVLKTSGAKLRDIEMGWRLRFLKALSDPNIAYILMMIGVVGIFFELSNPGLVFPGVVGGVALVLAFYAFQTLPVNYAGILLIILALIFFIAEVKITSYGLLSVAGVISLILGSVMLIDSPLPFMRVSLKIILPATLTLAGFFAILIRTALRSHRARVTMGKEGLIGAECEAMTDLDPEGDVFVQGAHWRASSGDGIRKGEKAVVVSVEGLRLKVTRKP